MREVKPSAVLEGLELPVELVIGKNGKPRIRVLSRNPEKLIEKAGRTCYKSEDKITARSARKFVKMLQRRKHNAMIEHSKATIRFVCDRGVSHEAVRQRIASFAQESTRYCNYGKAKHGSQITVIRPPFKHKAAHIIWERLQKHSEQAYLSLLGLNEPPELARSVLTNSLKTEIVIGTNFREWEWIFHLRTALAAHPQMREAMAPALEILRLVAPAVFEKEEVKPPSLKELRAQEKAIQAQIVNHRIEAAKKRALRRAARPMKYQDLARAQRENATRP